MDRKRKPTDKKYQDAPGKVQQQVSPLMSSIQMSGVEIYGVSALDRATGTTTTDPWQLIVKDVPLSMNAVLASASELNPLIEAPISELIKAYSTARGYTTEVNYTKVSQYVSESLNALAILFHMFRAQNVSQLKTDSGIDVGAIMGSRPTSQISSLALANYLGGASSLDANYVNDGAVAISNAAWSRDWLSQLTHIKLSEPLVKWAAAHFSVFYAVPNDRGASTVISFVPSVLTTSTDIAAKTRFDSYIGAMATARQTDSDLVDILNFLGFTNEEVLTLDFTRDSRGLTLPLAVDESLPAVFANSNLYGLGTSDDDIANMYFDVNGQFSVMNYPEDVQLNGDVLFAHKYLAGHVAQHHVVKLAWNGGSDFVVPIFPQSIGIELASVGSAQADNDRCATTTRNFQVSGLPALPYAYNTQLITAGGVLQFNTTSAVDTRVIDGANAYVLPDTYEFYEEVKKAELIMNNVEYRAKLQSLSNSIRTRSITKPS